MVDDGWDPSGESENSKSEQDNVCMDLQHGLHWLHSELTRRYTTPPGMCQVPIEFRVWILECSGVSRSAQIGPKVWKVAGRSQ
jgi:hypothetical protein